MRIVKDPDERKQEIIDGAIHRFAEKGYDKTSISDIAKSLGISQGLCYRYFASKEEIYDAAIEQYANLIVEQNMKRHVNVKTIREIVYETTKSIDNFTAVEKENTDLYQLFHSPGNRRMHNELSIRVVEKVIPHVAETIAKANETGELHVDDPQAIATFGLHGQMGIFMLEGITDEEKMSKIRSTWLQLLGLK